MRFNDNSVVSVIVVELEAIEIELNTDIALADQTELKWREQLRGKICTKAVNPISVGPNFSLPPKVT